MAQNELAVSFNFLNAQLSMNFIMLINVKMPTSDIILPFISMIDTTSESFESFYFLAFQFL